MKPILFCLSLLGLLLMISGFFVQQATKIPFVEHWIAPSTADARKALEALLEKGASYPRSIGFGGPLENHPFISEKDEGFNGLVNLYSEIIRGQSPVGVKIDKVIRFVDTCALVPDKRGSANLVLVEWAHGQQTATSYEEIRELISKSFDRSIWPLQLWLFIVGALLQVAMLAVTYFPKKETAKSSNEVTSKTKCKEDSTTKTDDPNPTEE